MIAAALRSSAASVSASAVPARTALPAVLARSPAAALRAEVADGLGRLDGIRVFGIDGNVLFDVSADLREQRDIVWGAERDRLPRCLCACGSPDSVDVCFGLFGQVEIYDERHILYVDAARCDVGCNKRAEFARAEIFESRLAGGLRFIPVNRRRRESARVELFGELVCAVFCAAENERERIGVCRLPLFQDVGEQVGFVLRLEVCDALVDFFDSRAFGRNRNALGVGDNRGCKFADFVRKGCGEKQGLAFFGQLGDDFANVGDKAHIEHSVGFVEYQKFDAAEFEFFLFPKVEKASGGGDENIDAD